MKFKSFLHLGLMIKVALAAIVAVLLLAVTLMYFYRRQMTETAHVALGQRATTLGSSIARECEYGLAIDKHPLLQRVATKALGEADVMSVVVFDDQGEVVAAAGHIDTLSRSQAGARLVARFTQTGTTRLPEESLDDAIETFYTPVFFQPTTPLTGNGSEEPADATVRRVGQKLGLVELRVSNATTVTDLRLAEQQVFLVTCITAGLVCLLCVVVVERMIRPLRTLVKGTDQLAAGNLSVRVAPSSADEIGELARSFNHLAEALAVSRQQVLDEQTHMEQRIAERTAALKEAHERLRQSQKLEEIGRLAGGIAHDFNNILTVITGYTALMAREIESTSPLRRNIDEVKKAAERASSLTRQLLAFSRKQVLQPKVLDLNVLVTGMEKMLRRLIGEDIDLRTTFDPRLARIKADPGQLEQVIMNLAVNARDAMPTGGKLTITTKMERLPSELTAPVGDAGQLLHVLLTVTDTGIGMTEQVMAHMFEPFYTTKGTGKGTGLGLAMCYGIIKQSHGQIQVFSKPDQGSTFKIYLPAITEEAEVVKVSAEVDAPQRGHETVLIVEDEEALRDLAIYILRDSGYTVLSARNGEEGLQMAQQDPGRKIDLVVTDVIMPRMSGREMAERLKTQRPATKILFMSGYTADALAKHGVLDPEIALIEKPFSPGHFAGKVREVLGPAGAN